MYSFYFQNVKNKNRNNKKKHEEKNSFFQLLNVLCLSCVLKFSTHDKHKTFNSKKADVLNFDCPEIYH